MTLINPFIFGSGAAGSTYDDMILADSPVLYIPLDDTSGTTATALVGANGTYNGSPALGATGPTEVGSTAVTFDAVNDYVQIPDADELSAPSGGGGFSIELWVRATDTDGWIATKGHQSGNYEWGLYTRSTATIELFVINTGNGTALNAQSAGSLLSDEAWHHVVGIIDSTNDEAFVYLDGSLVASDTTVSGTPNYGGSNPVVIGRRLDQSNLYGGDAAAFAIYDYALTTTQISDHAAGP